MHVLDVGGRHRKVRGVLHFLFEFASFLIDLIERFGVVTSPVGVVREKTLDPVLHRRETAGRVDARSDAKAEVARRGVPHAAARHIEERGDARMRAALADALEALRDENAVVFVEFHDVGHRAEGDEVDEFVEARLRLRGKGAFVAQSRAKRKKHVKDDADACERL